MYLLLKAIILIIVKPKTEAKKENSEKWNAIGIFKDLMNITCFLRLQIIANQLTVDVSNRND